MKSLCRAFIYISDIQQHGKCLLELRKFQTQVQDGDLAYPVRQYRCECHEYMKFQIIQSKISVVIVMEDRYRRAGQGPWVNLVGNMLPEPECIYVF
jgi:hypothetical protein